MADQATERSPGSDPPLPDGDRVADLIRRRAGASEYWVPLEGTSMEPTITAPAEALIKPGGPPRWGEVWAFVNPAGELTVHRVLHRRRDHTWVMRGDGSKRTDLAVPFSRLVGRAVAVRYGDPSACSFDNVCEPRPIRRSRWFSVRLQLRRAIGFTRYRVERALRRQG